MKVAVSSVYFTPYLTWVNMSFLVLIAACATCRVTSVGDPDPYDFGLGLLDLDPLVRGTDPDLVPTIIKQI